MKVYIEVYGCTANKSDASLIKGLLLKNDYKIVNDIGNADLLIILTCTVIDTTQQRMISRLKVFKNTGKKIIVSGCMASVQKEIIKRILPAALILPPRYTYQIVDLINNKKLNFIELDKTNFPKYYSDISAPISISEGCMFSCSYCITSIARGKLRSYPIDEIKDEVINAIKMGCREIQLTSQDTASYGLEQNYTLGDLLLSLSDIKGRYKIRVGMMNPHTLMNDFDKIIKGYENSKIYKFLHLPVQSGDNEVLEKMNRKYRIDDFIRIVKNFKDKFADSTISTDIIVGFPSESEEQFENTVKILNKVKPDITNITRYSARPYTEAKKLKGRIKTEIVKQRSTKLTELCKKISYERNKRLIGKEYKVMIIKHAKNNSSFGRADNYKPVVIDKKIKISKIVNVKIDDASSNYLVGSII